MRVLIVSQYFWPENFRVNDVATDLATRGHDVTVLTGVPNYPEGRVFAEYRADPAAFSTLGGVDIVRVPIFSRGEGGARLLLNYLSFVLSAGLLGPWRLRGRRFDAIFMFETSPITAALPAILLRGLKRAPLLMWVLDLWPETLSAVGAVRSRFGLAVVGRLVRFIYRRCDRILIASRGFVESVARHGVEPARVRWFPNWTDDSAAPGDPSRAAELNAAPEDFVLLFAGNIGEAQGLGAIVDAADLLRAMPNLRWLIVGSGRAEASVRAEVERRGLGPQVRFAGRVAPQRMPDLYARADALLVSLASDPLFALTVPGKIQSYLGAGKPIVAALDGEGARIVEEAGAGLASPAGDGAALAEAVTRLIALDPAGRAAMGERGRAYAEREFDRATLIARLEGWLAEAGGDSGGLAA